MKDSRIEISFNHSKFELNVKSLKENVLKYRNYLDAVEHITGKREFLSIEDIENHIKAKTSFSNVLLSAGLLEITEFYTFIRDNFYKINLEVLDVNGDEVTTKQTILDKVKEDSTLYLDECFVDEYKLLVKATEYLNKLKSGNSSNFLAKDYNGKFKVNLQALQNSNRI